MTMEQRKLYIGIDVHRTEHRVAIIPLELLQQRGNAWKKVIPLRISNNIIDFNRLDAVIRSLMSIPKEVTIAVDHTGGHYSEPIVQFLQTRGYSVYYLETKAVKAARERLLDQESKSDVIDSTSAAYLLYLRDLHGISFRISSIKPEFESRAAVLNSLVLQRLQLNKLATQATNRLHQYLLAVFPEGEARYFKQLLKFTAKYPTPKDIVKSDGLKEVSSLRQRDKEAILDLAKTTVGISTDSYRWLIMELTKQRSETMTRRKELKTVLEKQVREHPYWKILLSFPSVGEITAATIIGIVKEIDRWPDKKKLKKAIGVYNSFSQSGEGLPRTKRGKEGSRHGRRVLFLVCLRCATHDAGDNDFKDYYLRQVARGKPPVKSLVATMGKLAEILYHCLKNHEPYEYQGIYKSGTISKLSIAEARNAILIPPRKRLAQLE